MQRKPYHYGTRLPGYQQAYEGEKSRSICLADDHVRLVIASPSMESNNGQKDIGEQRRIVRTNYYVAKF